jgi:hypothetical protein
MVFTEYPKHGIVFFVGFGKVIQVSKDMLWNPILLEYPTWGTMGVLNSFGHEQYPSNGVDQNKSTHDV